MTIAESKHSYSLSKAQLHKESPEFKRKTKKESIASTENTIAASIKKRDIDENSNDECKAYTSELAESKIKSKQKKESPPFYPSKPNEPETKQKPKIGLRKESRPFMK